MKVVINRCFGGFGLSRKAFLRLRELGHELALKEPDTGEFWPGTDEIRDKFFTSFCSKIDRNDPLLIQVVEEMGSEEASSPYAALKIVEIPSDVQWNIDEYDGLEHIAENHRTWE